VEPVTQHLIPTSREVFEQIESDLADDRRRGRRTGVIVIAFDRPMAQAVRLEIMLRIRGAARDGDLVGQLSPQRFVVVVPRLREVDALAQLVVRLSACLRAAPDGIVTADPRPASVSGAISDSRSTAWSLVEAALRDPHRASA
jgi:GGDEF domain-containing protein